MGNFFLREFPELYILFQWTKYSLIFKNKISDKAHFLASKVIFYKTLAIWTFIDFFYELSSYKRGVAQFGNAGALGVSAYTNQKHSKN